MKCGPIRANQTKSPREQVPLETGRNGPPRQFNELPTHASSRPARFPAKLVCDGGAWTGGLDTRIWAFVPGGPFGELPRMKRIIGAGEFTDGSQRAVYEDDDGRQFVIDDEGQAVYGVWILVDEPVTLTTLDRAVASEPTSASAPVAEEGSRITNSRSRTISVS